MKLMQKSERPCDLISELYWLMRKAFEGRLEKIGITFLEFKVLMHLRETKTQGELLKSMKVSKATASKVLRSLENKGIIERERRGKSYRIGLTNKGLELLEEIAKAGKELDEKIFAEMSADERIVFVKLLRKAIKGLGGEE